MIELRLTNIRECRALTPMGWGLLIVVISIISITLILRVYPYLAPTHPVGGEILVVEGWLPDYTLEKVKGRFQQGKYELLITTGGNLMVGHHLSKYKTWSEVAAATLREQGFPLEKIILAPTNNTPRKDRTYSTALAVKKRISEMGLDPSSMDLISLGAHSRRTWLMFKKVFPSTNVGIITLKPKDYDINRWWQSSAGVRDIISEALAYFYARFIFRPPISK